MKAIPLYIICFALVLACTKKTSESTETESGVNEFGVVPDTTTSIYKESSQPEVPLGSLLIHGKDIWVRDYPNTGKVVMTLNEGDVCKILQEGRYDVIRDRGSRWFEIEFEGKTGWVFGSQTDKPSYDHSEGSSPLLENFLKKYNLIANQFNCEGLITTVYDEIVNNALADVEEDEDGNSLLPEIKSAGDSLQVNRRIPLGFLKQTFKPGPSTVEIKSILCNVEMGTASIFKNNKSLIASNHNGTCSFISELKGELKKILRVKNGKQILVTNYTETFIQAPPYRQGYILITVYDPLTNKITSVQKIGFFVSSIDDDMESPHGEPVQVVALFENASEKINLELLEEYSLNESDLPHLFRIKRFYQFNESKNLFEENKQEEILQ